MPFGKTLTPNRYPNGVTNVTPNSPFFRLEHLSPLHQLVLGWGYGSDIDLPTGNTPATTNVWTVTSTTTTGTASLNPTAIWPPMHLLTTGTTANDQVVLQEKRIVKKNHYALRKVIVFGSFQITSTVANAAIFIGVTAGASSLAALTSDQLLFNKPSGGATLNFNNRNNNGTLQTTAVSTAILINVIYGVAAYFDPFHNEVTTFFGVVDSLDFQLSTLAGSNIDLPRVNRPVTTTANIPDGTNPLNFGFGAQTTAGAAATVNFGPCGAVYVQ